MMARVHLRAEQMMTSQRIAQIAAYLVESLTSNTVLWQEVLYHLHTSCFDGQVPSRDKLSLDQVDAIQRDAVKAETFNPRTDTDREIAPTLFSARILPSSTELANQIGDLLWHRIKDTTNPAPLPSRVPDDPTLMAVYIEGVKLVYRLVEGSLQDGKSPPNSKGQATYSHSFMSAGEIAFGVLHSLDIVRDTVGTPPAGRYCNGPARVVFVQPVEFVEALIKKRPETAPSLGHVLCAVSYMSGQYGRGFDLQSTPAKVDDLAQDFICASQAAGLCARLDEDRALWLPFSDNDILSLYRCIDAGRYVDDLLSPAQQTSQLIRAKMPKALASLPKEIDFQTLHLKIIKPWVLLQNKIGWKYCPHHKIAQAHWIEVADALGITVAPPEAPFL